MAPEGGSEGEEEKRGENESQRKQFSRYQPYIVRSSFSRIFTFHSPLKTSIEFHRYPRGRSFDVEEKKKSFDTGSIARAQRTMKRRSGCRAEGNDNSKMQLFGPAYRWSSCHLSRNRKPPQIEGKKRDRGGGRRGGGAENEPTLFYSSTARCDDCDDTKNNLKAENNAITGRAGAGKRVTLEFRSFRRTHVQTDRVSSQNLFSLIIIARVQPANAGLKRVKKSRIAFLARRCQVRGDLFFSVEKTAWHFWRYNCWNEEICFFDIFNVKIYASEFTQEMHLFKY